MSTLTITFRGRITIPVDFRQALGVCAGDRIEFVEVEPGQFLLIAANLSVTVLKNVFGKPSNVESVQEMNQAAATRGNSLLP